MNSVKINITVKVTTQVELGDGETIEDLKNRLADIYLHGHGENGYTDKIDLGGDTVIEVIN